MSNANLTLNTPPAWDDAPPEFQVDLAALDRADDDALSQIANGVMSADFERRDDLLARNANGQLTPAERVELAHMRHEEDRFVLRKAHAAALLRWRGHAGRSP